jgi:hypothetical protein
MVPVWVQHFDNTEWTATTGAWSSDHWESAGTNDSQIVLIPNGSWVTGYRPSKVRVTITGVPDVTLQIIDTGWANICNYPGYESLDEAVISFTSYDIKSLSLYKNPGPYSVTNIEFYEE